MSVVLVYFWSLLEFIKIGYRLLIMNVEWILVTIPIIADHHGGLLLKSALFDCEGGVASCADSRAICLLDEHLPVHLILVWREVSLCEHGYGISIVVLLLPRQNELSDCVALLLTNSGKLQASFLVLDITLYLIGRETALDHLFSNQHSYIKGNKVGK